MLVVYTKGMKSASQNALDPEMTVTEVGHLVLSVIRRMDGMDTRFDSMDDRFDSMGSRFDTSIGDLAIATAKGFEAQDAKIDGVIAELRDFKQETTDNFKKADERFNKVDEKFELIDERFDSMDENFRKVHYDIWNLDEKFATKEEFHKLRLETE